ncbi:DUF1905 domain-containing protein [Naasia aerilata]|uniref:DUF1905 domain-containing protein n=1 Tax=Naasia aerilata TaxID=1162966 RepID=UPI00257342CF|nr:DUF1905 domain-containing protein [Naasia aerilata]
MAADLQYEFTAALWPWEVRRDLWTFVSLPDRASAEIAEFADGLTRGFGSVPVRVRIGTMTWRTSVFPGGTGGGYVLPVKRAVREANGVEVGDEVAVSLEVLVG